MLKINVLLALLIVFTVNALAEENPSIKIYYGLGAGYNRTYSDLFFSGLCSDPEFTGNNSSGGYKAGIFLEIATGGELSGSKGSVVVHLSFNRLNLINHVNITEIFYSIVEEGVKQGEKFYHFDEKLESYFNQATLDIYYKMPVFGSNFSLLAGASVSYNIKNNVSLTLTITDHGSMRFYDPDDPDFSSRVSDNGRTLLVSDEPVIGLEKYMFGLNLGAAYDFNIFSSIKITPYALYNAGLTRLLDKYEFWKVSYLQAGVSVMTLF